MMGREKSSFSPFENHLKFPARAKVIVGNRNVAWAKGISRMSDKCKLVHAMRSWRHMPRSSDRCWKPARHARPARGPWSFLLSPKTRAFPHFLFLYLWSKLIKIFLEQKFGWGRILAFLLPSSLIQASNFNFVVNLQEFGYFLKLLSSEVVGKNWIVHYDINMNLVALGVEIWCWVYVYDDGCMTLIFNHVLKYLWFFFCVVVATASYEKSPLLNNVEPFGECLVENICYKNM